MTKGLFKKIYSQRKSEHIIDQIYEAILRGDLKPNERFSSEQELAKVFGVSNLTIRESVRALEQMGLVEVRKGNRGGIYIKEMNLESMTRQVEHILRNPRINVAHLTEGRRVIEQSIFLQLGNAGTLPDAIIEQLNENIRNAEYYYKQGMNRERLRTNFEFHFILASVTQNPLLIIMQNVVCRLLYQFFEAVKPSQRMGLKTMQEHRAILEAIKAGNLNKAGKLCGEHIERVGRNIIQKSKHQSYLEKRDQEKSKKQTFLGKEG